MDEIRLVEWLEHPTVGIRQVVRWDDLTATFARAVPAAAVAVQRLGATPAGAPYARYRGRLSGGVDVEVGFPVVEPVSADDVVVDLPPGGELVVGSLPAVRAAEAVHAGSYDSLHETYARMESWVAGHELAVLDQSWEVYEAGPESDVDPATWRTRIVLPVTGPAVGAGPAVGPASLER